LAAFLLLICPTGLPAQLLKGRLGMQPLPVGRHILLYDTRGHDHIALDSTVVGPDGGFAFPDRCYPSGFYKLGLDEKDRVDIILDDREEVIDLRFHGHPLQLFLTVVQSKENQRLWEYKFVSQRVQKQLGAMRQERDALPRNDPGRASLDSLEAQVLEGQQRALDRLVGQDTSSYFAHVVLAERRLTAASQDGPTAVRDAFDWGDTRLLRSTVYAKAIMTYLQNVPPGPASYNDASDSLLHWASRDIRCWIHVRSLLFRMFNQYGPDATAQHLVDRYMSGPDALVPPETDLLGMLTERRRLGIGAQAPDVALPDPVARDTVQLRDILAKHRYTALFFYSSTCDHCHEQMPGLRRLYADMRGRGFEMVGIALDDDVGEFLSTITEQELDWPSYSDLIAWGSPAAKAFAVQMTPTLFLLDGKGRIVAKPYDHEELRTRLDGLLR